MESLLSKPLKGVLDSNQNAVNRHQLDAIRYHRYHFHLQGKDGSTTRRASDSRVYNFLGIQRMANGEEWLTVTQAAEISDYHPERIRELIREGKINAHKYGTVWAVYKTSLMEYLQTFISREPG